MQKIIILAVTVALLGAACQKKSTSITNTAVTNTTTNTAQTNSDALVAPVTWEFTGSVWRAMGTPPACPSPLGLLTPVDLTKATAVLYPGQIRGNNYKPHGGFRFDASANNEITVVVPIDAFVVQGARYIEGGEVQYLFELQAPCGLQYRFDHLLTLSSTFQALADQLPAAVLDDSRTTKFTTPVPVEQGDLIATAVGFTKTKNVSVDFGTYDLRQQNTIAANASWATAHANEKSLAYFGTCWFDYLNLADKTRVLALPAGDQAAGKTSDYCLTP